MTDSLAGYFARYDGEELACSLRTLYAVTEVRLYRDSAADGFTEVAPARYVRSVPIEDCDLVGYRDEIGTWNGEDALVISDNVDTLTIEYVGGDGPNAVRLGYAGSERGVFRAIVPTREVRDRHRRVTLLTTSEPEESPAPQDR